MSKETHFHQYEKLSWPNGRIFYKCMSPGCKHYLPLAELAIGRESLCWGGCNRLVVITREDVTREVKRPMCSECKEERMNRKEALRNI